MYQQTQTAYGVVSLVLLVGAIPLGVLLLAPPAPGVFAGRVIAICVLLILAACGAIFSRMRIEVDCDELSWHFAFGLLRKSVPLNEISRVESTRTSALEGWGIHLTPRGWLYNISGFDAVWIHLRSGKQFLLGTRQPSQLVDAIENARSGESAEGTGDV